MSIPEVVAKRSRRSGPRLSEGSSFFFVHSLRADSIVRSSRGIATGLGLLDYDKDIALFHRLARRDLDLGHFTFLGRFEFVLHLHRFDHDHTLLKGHGVARLDKNVDDPPGHHRAKLDPSGRLRTRRASAAKRSPGSINQRDTSRTAARGHDYLVAVGDNVQVEAPIVDQDREGGGPDAADVDVELIRAQL